MPSFIAADTLSKAHRKPTPTERAVDHAVDVDALEADLRKGIEGEVRFDRGSRALYAADASNYRQVPIGVVIPRTAEDVVETVAAARRSCLAAAGPACAGSVAMSPSSWISQSIFTTLLS